MRRHDPRMVNPLDTARNQTARALGVGDQYDLNNRIATLERTVAMLTQQNANAAQVAAAIAGEASFSFATPQILTTSSVKGSVTPTNVTSTTGTTITNSNLSALILGVPYLVVGIADMDMNAPAGQSMIAVMRIGALGSNIDGTRTATVGGERRGTAVAFQIVMGDGASTNIAGRARVTGGTGTINDCVSYGIAIPLGAMLQV